MRLFLMLFAVLISGSAFAADTTATLSSTNATSASTTISLLPLWLQMIPYLATGIGALFVAVCGWAAYKITGKQLSDSDRATIQTAASNAAGRVLAQVDGPISNISFDVRSPFIAKEVTKMEASVGDKMKSLGMTPERTADLILGKIGLAQTVAAAGTVVPAPVPAVPARGL